MKIINAVIENTDTPEIQAILAKLNPEEDILFTDELSDDGIVVEYIEPINNIKTIGNVPKDVLDDVHNKYGENVSIDINDYAITFDNGLYGLVVDFEVNELEAAEESLDSEKKLPLPLLVVVGFATALLTIILIIVKLMFSNKKK